MKEFTQHESASSRSTPISETGRGAGYEIRLPGRGFRRWAAIAIITGLSTAAAWIIGQEVSKRIDEHELEDRSRHHAPLPDAPPLSKTAKNNNALMRLGLVPDLDGIAIAYTAEASQLVSGGQFRTDLSLEDTAALLRVPPEAIANPDSPGELDPDAELFRAQTGRLTEDTKAASRKMRRRFVAEGRRPDYAFGKWEARNFSFTLNRLKHPDIAETLVLNAILRSAAEIMPEPGDKVRAIPTGKASMDAGVTILGEGMLPVETPEQAAQELQAAP